MPLNNCVWCFEKPICELDGADEEMIDKFIQVAVDRTLPYEKEDQKNTKN